MTMRLLVCDEQGHACYTTHKICTQLAYQNSRVARTLRISLHGWPKEQLVRALLMRDYKETSATINSTFLDDDPSLWSITSAKSNIASVCRSAKHLGLQLSIALDCLCRNHFQNTISQSSRNNTTAVSHWSGPRIELFRISQVPVQAIFGLDVTQSDSECNTSQPVKLQLLDCCKYLGHCTTAWSAFQMWTYSKTGTYKWSRWSLRRIVLHLFSHFLNNHAFHSHAHYGPGGLCSGFAKGLCFGFFNNTGWWIWLHHVRTQSYWLQAILC